MSQRKKVIHKRLNSRIKRLTWMLRILILILTGFVVYDALVLKTPLYYIAFLVAGRFAGTIYRKIYRVDHDSESDQFDLNTGVFNVVLTVMLIVFRFAFAEQLLQYLRVQWINDGLYLFFIGIHWSKLHILYSQMEEMTFHYLVKNQKSRGHTEPSEEK
jgi:uncharacterized membrane protein HdeD (DUF308 family)